MNVHLNIIHYKSSLYSEISSILMIKWQLTREAEFLSSL